MLPFISTIIRYLRSIGRGWRDHEFRWLTYFVMVILGSGTIFYHLVEKWSWLDSLFFSTTTLTTVGYGNLVPVTNGGKIFTIVYILLGIGVILGFVNAIAVHGRNGRREIVKPNNQSPV